MSIAWATLVFIALLLPGIFFFIGLATYERLSREIIRSSVISEVAMAIMVALILHALSIIVLSAFGFRLSEFVNPLAEYGSTKPEELVKQVSARLLLAVFYLVITTGLDLCLGV